MSPTDLEVMHIGVNSEHRGKGFGNRLMDYLTILADKYSVTKKDWVMKICEHGMKVGISKECPAEI